METLNKQLARIESAKLSLERDFLQFWVFVNYEEGGSQGIGGIVLDNWSDEHQRRVGTAYGCEMIRRLLTTFGVNDLSELAGRQSWVLGEGEGFGFKPKGLQSLRTEPGSEKPFLFDETYKDFKDKE